MVNGLVYDFESIKVLLPTGLVLLVEDANYNDKKDDEVITGVNSIPAGIGQGEYSGECELKIGRIEYDKLNLFAGASGGFYNMPPIPVIVSYGHLGQIPTIDSMLVHFTERDLSGSKGDKPILVTLKGPLTAPLISNGIPAYVPL
jgi:hypothetical protein